MSGYLEETTGRLADFLEKDQESRLKVSSSLIYPSIILIVGCITLFILFTWVIPRIMVIFDDMDQIIPVMTQILMGISFFFSKFWWVLLTVVVSGSAVFVRWHKTTEGRYRTDHRLFSFPWLGNFIREIAVARFARTLGTLLQGGVDMVPALSYASQVVGNQYIQGQLSELSEYVAGGMPLSQAIRQGKIFSEADVSMLSVGEETGSLSTGLFKLASFYEKNNDRRITVMTTMVEPALILGLGLVIGFVVLAMLMPIFQMNLAVR